MTDKGGVCRGTEYVREKFLGGNSMKQNKGFSKVLTENVGFWFVLPWLVGFLCFKVYPFASSLYYSFTNYDLFAGISKHGLMN